MKCQQKLLHDCVACVSVAPTHREPRGWGSEHLLRRLEPMQQPLESRLQTGRAILSIRAHIIHIIHIDLINVDFYL